MAARSKSSKRWVVKTSDQVILKLCSELRNQWMRELADLSDRQLSVIPDGFRNNLHWQVGHVLTITDELIYQFSGAGTRIPDSYRALFATGTSPRNWLEQPPEATVMKKQAEEQMQDICEQYDGKLSLPVADQSNFLEAKVIAELFYVLIAHESMHVGMMTAMAKIVRAQ